MPSGSASRDFDRALDHEIPASLNVRRTALRVIDLVRTRIGDEALLILEQPSTRTLHLLGGAEDRSGAASRTSGAVAAARRLLQGGISSAAEAAAGTLAAELRELLLPGEPRDNGLVLVLPLRARGGVTGALLLARPAGSPFTDADVSLAERVADRAGPALDAAMVHEEHGRVTRVLEHSLRPPYLPALGPLDLAACFRPAGAHLEIGGDFYDVHGEEGDWLLVLGDVCGKGVEAAVLNGRARQSIRTAAHFDRSPGRILDVLNDVLREEDSDRFVTVACCRARYAGAGRLDVDLAVAGHPAPLVVRANGTVEQPSVTGPLAGVMQHDEPYREVRFQLLPGDVLVLFSDGIYEARGPSGEYGMHRLSALVSRYAAAGAGAGALSEAVERDVLEHLSGQGHDDITALILAVREPERSG